MWLIFSLNSDLLDLLWLCSPDHCCLPPVNPTSFSVIQPAERLCCLLRNGAAPPALSKQGRNKANFSATGKLEIIYFLAGLTSDDTSVTLYLITTRLSSSWLTFSGLSRKITSVLFILVADFIQIQHFHTQYSGAVPTYCDFWCINKAVFTISLYIYLYL